MADQTRRILIKVDAQDKSLNSIKGSFKELNKTVKESSGMLQGFKNTFQALVGASILGVGIKELANMADKYQKLNDRITVFEGSQSKAATTMAGLAQVADRTNTSIGDIATVYSRLALSLGETGVSSKSLLFITESLQNSFRLAGATTAEATAATIQLSQGLASGTLRGQELRSVLESNALIGGLLAKELGTTRGQLMKLAEAGKITSDVFLRALSRGAIKLEEDAKKLGITFQEATDRGLNKFTIALGELNREFGLSKKYDSFLQALPENFALIAGAMVTVAGLAIPLLIVKLKALEFSLLTNPITFLPTVLALVAGGAVYAALNFDRFSYSVIKLGINLKIAFLEGIELVQKLSIKTLDFFGATEKAAKERKGFAILKNDINNFKLQLIDLDKAAALIEKGKNPFALAEQESVEARKKQLDAEIKALAEKLARDKKNQPRDLKKELDALNTAFNAGKVPLENYNLKLRELTHLMNDGKSPSAYADAMNKLKIDEIARDFEYGVTTLAQFNAQMEKEKISQLKQKFDAGRISVAEYNKELLEVSTTFQPGAAVFTGINNYIESSGTLAQNISKNITLVFNTLEDTLFEFVKKGTFEFKKFATAVLDDLTRIILRAAIIQPLANGILGSLGGLGDTATASNGGSTSSGYTISPTADALGAAYNNGIRYFANGGIFDKPTMFNHSGGLGVMGEAGPEAVMPLTRGKNGKLGVAGGGAGVTVNVINQTDAQATTQESTGANGERVIDVLISNRVRETFANGGMDKTMRQLYGVSRRGN